MPDLVPVINPQGETVQIAQSDFKDGQPPAGYKVAAADAGAPAVPDAGAPDAVAPTKPPVAEAPKAPDLSESQVPDKPDFMKVINKKTGEAVLLKKDQLDIAPTAIYAPYSKEAEDNIKKNIAGDRKSTRLNSS